MLTVRERILGQKMAEGLERSEAYVEAGYKAKNKEVARSAVCRLLKNKPEILEYVGELQKEEDDRLLLSRRKKRLLLAEIATGKAIKSEGFLFEVVPSHRERIAAVAEDNKLTGDYAVEESHVSVEGNLFEGVFELLKGNECVKRPSGLGEPDQESGMETE